MGTFDSELGRTGRGDVDHATHDAAPGKRTRTRSLATVVGGAPEAMLGLAAASDGAEARPDGVGVYHGAATRGALADLGVRGAAMAGRAFVGDSDPALLAHELAHAHGADEDGATRAQAGADGGGERSRRADLDAALPWIEADAGGAQFWGGRTNQAGVTLRPQPDLTGAGPVLAIGTAVDVLEERPDWLRVRTPDHREGWIPRRTVERAATPPPMDGGMDGGTRPPTSTTPMDGSARPPTTTTPMDGGMDASVPSSLEQRWRNAVAAGRWRDAALALAGYNDDDMITRLTALTRPQRTQLHAAGLGVGGPTPARYAQLMPRVDLEAAYAGAVAAHQWQTAATHLRGFDAAAIATHVQALSGPDRAAMRAAIPTWNNAVSAALLDADLQAMLAGGRWRDAALALAHYNDDDLRARLAPLTTAQRTQVYAAGLGVGGPTPARYTALLPALDLEAAYAGAVAAHQWQTAAIHLNGFNDADIATHVAALSPADRTAMRTATPAWDHRVRAALLSSDLTGAIAGGQWHDAALALAGFNDDDLVARFTAMTHAQRVSLYAAGVVLGGPSPARFTQLVPRVDRASAIEGAAAAGQWETAARHLDGHSDPDLLPAVQALPAAQLPSFRAGAAAAFSDDNHRVRRTIAFVIAAPPAHAPGGDLGGPPVVPGTQTSTPVPGGTATVSTNSNPTGAGPNDWFSMNYQGANAAQTGWLQFIAIELEMFDASGASLGFDVGRDLPAPGYRILTSRPGAHRWYLDSIGASAPFYDSPRADGAAGVHQNGPSQTEMHDRPGSDPTVVADLFTRPNVARVVERERFHDYLVRGMEVLFRSELYVQFVWTSAPGPGAGDPPRTHVPVSQGPASSITTGQHQELIRRHPSYGYLPHH